MSKLSKIIKVYGHPFSIRKPNGKGTIEIQFTDGYVTIHSVQPRTSQFNRDIHITRQAWYQLLSDPRLKQATRLMEGPSFDRYRAERVYAAEEQKHLEELRQQKRARRSPRRRRRSQS